MNVNAANEDMLSASELKKLPLGGEGERKREGGGQRVNEIGDELEDRRSYLCNRFIFVIMFCLH